MTARGGGHGSGGGHGGEGSGRSNSGGGRGIHGNTIHLLLYRLSLNWLTNLFSHAALVILHYAM